jgi:hypothetical protein
MSTEIRPSLKSLFSRKIGRVRTAVDTLPMSGGRGALRPNLVHPATVMILCQASKLGELGVDSFLAFGVDGHRAPRQLARFARMAVVRALSSELLRNGRGPQASPVRHTFAGDRQETVPTLRMLTNDSGRRSACPQEWVEQAVKGVRGFDGVGTLLLREARKTVMSTDSSIPVRAWRLPT